MRNPDREVLEFARDTSGSGGWLVTIIAATGSSPRPVGSLLALDDAGRQAGSVSGGCVEEDLLERLGAGEFSGMPLTTVEYGVSAEENARLGLPCGGQLVLLLQRLQPGDSHWLQALLDATDERYCLRRDINLGTGDTSLVRTPHFSAPQLTETAFSQVFGPRQRLLLVGAGELAAALAELALAMDYEVLVTDPRQTTLDQWRGPEVRRLQGMPDDIVRQEAADRFSIVITLTHDPRIDDMALMEALETDAWYVGALGSLRTTEKRLQRLRELGLPDAAIERLHAPVGLDIGSKTPVEIAVAIMAELTQLRRRNADAIAA